MSSERSTSARQISEVDAQETLSEAGQHTIRYRKLETAPAYPVQLRLSALDQLILTAPEQDQPALCQLVQFNRVAILEQLADILPTLTESEFRILFELTRQAARYPTCTTTGSVRKLQKISAAGKMSVFRALAELERRDLIKREQQSGNKETIIRVNFLLTLPMSVPNLSTPALFDAASVPKLSTPVNLNPYASVPNLSTGTVTNLSTVRAVRVTNLVTPSTENQQLAEPGAAYDDPLDIRNDLLPIEIDRVIQPKGATRPDEQELREAGAWMFKLMRTNGPHVAPNKPDRKIIAEFLRVAPWPRLHSLLFELMNTATQIGENYAWFVTVAMQRIHNVRPEVLRERRVELKLINKMGKAQAAELLTQRAQAKPPDALTEKERELLASQAKQPEHEPEPAPRPQPTADPTEAREFLGSMTEQLKTASRMRK